MFIKHFLSIVFCIVILLFPTHSWARATTTDDMPAMESISDVSDVVIRGRIVRVIEEGVTQREDGTSQVFQKVEVEIIEGDEKGKKVTINHGGLFAIDMHQKVQQGETVVLNKPTFSAQGDVYYITDHYRNGRLIMVAIFFLILVVLFGGWRGFTALLGMVFSAGVVFYGIAPKVLSGSNAFEVTLVGGIVILVVSLYVSHGFSRRTSVAVVASLVTLIFAAVVNYAAVVMSYLTGGGTEEAFYVQIDGGSIDLRGLLLGGIIIGVLGVLDDITTAQTATVEEIHRADPDLSFSELYKRGLSVGREHIASLVNTLVLAYAGASFPVVLLYILHKNTPLWLVFNSNFIAEEIVRTLVGSSALVVAVPITTALAAVVFSRRELRDIPVESSKPQTTTAHHHTR